MGKRLVSTLQKLTNNRLAEKGIKPFISARRKAEKEGVSVVTIYNRIRSGKLEGGNFEGRVFVRDE